VANFVFDKERTVECVKMLAEMYYENTGNVPRILVAVGGSAMVLRDLRSTSEDVDVFVLDEELINVARVLEAETGFTVDVTSNRNLWGELDIHDIEDDAEVMKNFDLAGHNVNLSAISAETLFVIKASSLREKDKDDLELLWPYVDPQELMVRVGTLFSNQPDIFYAEEMVVNVLGEMQVLTGEPVQISYFDRVPEELRSAIMPIVEENFGAMMAASSHKVRM
jgi:predicted nucleotidyltransferase